VDDFQAADGPPAVRLVAELLQAATECGASAVHLGHVEGALIVRFRVSESMREWRRIPHSLRRAVGARLKLIAGLDITERRMPQHGRMRLGAAEWMVGTLPCSDGEETMVLRRLEAGAPVHDLRECGHDRELLEGLERAALARSGLVMIVGPARSGRATTRCAMVARALKAGRVVMTAEEWVGRRMPGATQIALNASIGFSMGAALRAVGRSDADVVATSEVMDHEGADQCLRLALGRLVVCSMHVAGAAEACARLQDMGFEPHVIGTSLRMIVAQRLLRRLCRRCREPERLPEEVASRHGLPPRIFRANGCAECGGSGYAGLVMVSEGFEVDEAARRLIARGERPRVRRTLREAATEHVASGVTSLAEAFNT